MGLFHVPIMNGSVVFCQQKTGNRETREVNVGDRLSRSEVKRRIKEVEKLVQALAALPPAEIPRMPLAEEWQELFLEIPALKGGARKRQIKYLTKILRDRDNQDLYRFLSDRKGDSLARDRDLHRLEYLRDTLLAEAVEAERELRAVRESLPDDWSSRTVETIVARWPAADAVMLRRLSAMFARTRNKRHAREIFRILQAAREKKKREAMA